MVLYKLLYLKMDFLNSIPSEMNLNTVNGWEITDRVITQSRAAKLFKHSAEPLILS